MLFNYIGYNAKMMNTLHPRHNPRYPTLTRSIARLPACFLCTRGFVMKLIYNFRGSDTNCEWWLYWQRQAGGRGIWVSKFPIPEFKPNTTIIWDDCFSVSCGGGRIIMENKSPTNNQPTIPPCALLLSVAYWPVPGFPGKWSGEFHKYWK